MNTMNDKKPFNQQEYINAWNRDHYDTLSFRLPKGRKADVQERARRLGMSLNAYMYALVDADLNVEIGVPLHGCLPAGSERPSERYMNGLMNE